MINWFQRLFTPLHVEIKTLRLRGEVADYYYIYIFIFRVAIVRAWGLK